MCSGLNDVSNVPRARNLGYKLTAKMSDKMSMHSIANVYVHALIKVLLHCTHTHYKL